MGAPSGEDSLAKVALAPQLPTSIFAARARIWEAQHGDLLPFKNRIGEG